MSIKLTFLGSGGAFTDFRVNYHNNAIVHTDVGYILIDCGGTAVQSLKELGIPVWDITAVIITHMHGDHMGGLEQLLWERYYTGPDGPGWLKTPVYATPDIHRGLRHALMDCVDEITTPAGTVAGGYDVLVKTHSVGEIGFALGGVGFNLHRTRHVYSSEVDKPCYGVDIIDMSAGPRAYFTSDTTFDENLFQRNPGNAAVVFHDCAFGPFYTGTVHTHYEELRALPEETRGRIVLMHYTEVPEGIDPVADGFLGVAARHSDWVID